MQKCRNSGAKVQIQDVGSVPLGVLRLGAAEKGPEDPIFVTNFAPLPIEQGAFFLFKGTFFVIMLPWLQNREHNRAHNLPNAVNFSCQFQILGPPNFGQPEILSLTIALAERGEVMMRKSWWALFI